MRLITTALAGVLAAGAIGLGGALAATAQADPPPPPQPPGDVPPPDAPKMPPPPVWGHGNPVVWNQTGYRWGVWMNGYFLPIY